MRAGTTAGGAPRVGRRSVNRLTGGGPVNGSSERWASSSMGSSARESATTGHTAVHTRSYVLRWTRGPDIARDSTPLGGVVPRKESEGGVQADVLRGDAPRLRPVGRSQERGPQGAPRPPRDSLPPAADEG